MAQKLTSIVDDLNDENWESSFCKILQAIRDYQSGALTRAG